MGTNLAIDDDLIEQARRIGGHHTKKQAAIEAETGRLLTEVPPSGVA